MSVDLRKGPVKKIHTYVFNNLPESKLKYYSKFSGDLCYYEEPSDEMQWEISDSTMNILGYECSLAHSDYHGRKWDAWFTTEIPLPFGPMIIKRPTARKLLRKRNTIVITGSL